ncbi:MAG TPA: zf-HC2 domain-containing protein [Pyrinomonadaceae bacterium]|nr:zf-HC2 domain-containing protein [Pyrinomonadaceae bacterium]
MKCEVCLELLEEYLDGELPGEDSEQVGAHLIKCGDCSAGFAALTAEQELFARYDREIEVPPFMWTRVAAHTVSENNKRTRSWFVSLFARPATAVAMLLLTVTVGVVYLISRQPTAGAVVKQADPTLPRNGTDPVQEGGSKVATTDQRSQAAPTDQPATINQSLSPTTRPGLKPELVVASNRKLKSRIRPTINHTTDQSGVLSSDLGYLDMDEQDTARHIEQTENFLRSIRNFPVSDGEEEIDVTYDKALSRRLLNENVVLRRDAEMKAKFPTKTLLADLEPFLIDIANLPDRARPEDLRVIKERVKKTEIVAALLDYQDRGPNNR